MVYFMFVAGTPYAGTETERYQAFEERPSDEELDEMADELCELNAESYDYLVTGWDNDAFDNEEDEAEAIQNYYADCYGRWEEISQEEFEENT